MSQAESLSGDVDALVEKRKRAIVPMAQLYVAAIDFDPGIRKKMIMENKAFTPVLADWFERIGRGEEPTAGDILIFDQAVRISELRISN